VLALEELDLALLGRDNDNDGGKPRSGSGLGSSGDYFGDDDRNDGLRRRRRWLGFRIFEFFFFRVV
jgi:hypothetical protein